MAFWRRAGGYAVVDLETTGLSARDRIVEIAVVQMSATGVVEGRWETLVNPNRDMGPQNIHRISASSAAAAPVFRDIADDVLSLLHGRVPVAHNAPFDSRFLHAELKRAGKPVHGQPSWLCTMRLMQQVIPGTKKLADCCTQLGIPFVDAHRASADAQAAAALLAVYLRKHPKQLKQLRNPAWQVPAHHRKTAPTFARWVNRDTAATTKPERPMPPLTPEFRLSPGDIVVITGQTHQPRETLEALITRHGLTPGPSVTKKTRLLVAADPDTQSTKAQKARQYGTPIVTEDGFLSLLNKPSPAR